MQRISVVVLVAVAVLIGAPRYSICATFFRGSGIRIGTSTTFGYRFSPSSKIGEYWPVLILTRTM